MHTSSLKQNNYKLTPQETKEVLNDYEAEEQNEWININWLSIIYVIVIFCHK